MLCLFLVAGKLNSSEDTRFCRTVKRWAICHTRCPIHTVSGNKVESAMPAHPEAAPRHASSMQPEGVASCRTGWLRSS